jgi:PPOX class probable F420-dependent enzyme
MSWRAASRSTATGPTPPSTTSSRHHSSATLLVDHYDDDWSALWWIRMEGDADIAEPGSPAHEVGVRLLAGKYEPYRDRPPPGTMIVIRIDAWRAWP